MPTTIESKADFEETPEGQAEYWQTEFAAAKKEVEKWHKRGEEILKRFRDERDRTNSADTRWNLYTANVQTLSAMLYGQTPSVTVARRFSDSGDDIARVAAEMMERLLNSDIERDGDNYALALQYALSDRLIPGMGNVRLRYVAEFEQRTVEAITSPETGAVVAEGYTEEVKAYEDVEIDYVHWKDQLWSPSRIFHEARWWAFKALMSRDELVKRFPEEGERVPLNAKKKGRGNGEGLNDPWGRAEVWEIWCKESGSVYWYVEGYDRLLDARPDPLGLDGFWPFPRPMFANLTTSSLVPTPDYVIAQDLYSEINSISTRIQVLQRSLRAAGVYDSTAGALQRLVTESSTGEAVLVPVDNWALFAEKGGVRGHIDWLPLDQVVMALAQLREQRNELINALYQVTGMSDIMRGQASSVGVTATEQGIKAKFGSVRVQSLQDEFARFASDVQKLKAELIARHFDVRTILERSNAQYGFDAQMAPRAAELLKTRFSTYRIEVKPEAVSLTDFAQLKAERTEFLAALSGFLTAAAPLAQQVPGSLPYLLQMLQWTMAGLKGSSQIEGVLDQAIQKAQELAQMQQAMPQQQAPDPKVQAMQLKGQLDAQKGQFELQKTQAKLQADLTRIAAETQSRDMQEQSQAKWNVQEAAAKKRINQAGNVLPFGPQGPGGNGL
jgi:hypothetical protein